MSSKNNDLSRVDMHVHSKYSHDCSTSLEDIGEAMKRKHVGVALTDHNEVQGSLNLKKLYPKALIIPAIEVTSVNSKDLLLYFDKHSELSAFYERHIKPNKKLTRRINKTTLSTNYILDIASDYNAFRVLPHPFMRIKGSFRKIKKDPSTLKFVDGIEVLNASKSKKDNQKSVEWCKELNMPFTAGSDSHILSTLGNARIISKANTPSLIMDEIKKKQVEVEGESDGFLGNVRGIGAIVRNKLTKRRI